MKICPECGAPFSEGATTCASCDWVLTTLDGIPVMLNVKDRESSIFREYLENYDRIADDDLDQGILDPTYVRHQVANMVSYLENLEGKTVADVGSGQGGLAKAMLTLGASKVTLFDIAIPYLKRLASNAQFTPIFANAENLPFKEHFDVLTTTDVMEHVLNVGAFLCSINNALVMGGHAYVRIPYNEDLIQYAPQTGCPYQFVHLRSFDKKILKTYFEGAGFRIKKFHFDGFFLNGPQRFWIRGFFRRATYYVLKNILKNLLKDPNTVARWPFLLAGFMMRPITIVVVAKKVRNFRS